LNREKFVKLEVPHIEIPPASVVPQLEYFKERHPIYGMSSPALANITTSKQDKQLKRTLTEAENHNASPTSAKKKKKSKEDMEN
jgi:hypothetical protein